MKETNMQYQQHLRRWGLALIILRPEKESREGFYALAPALSAALDKAVPGRYPSGSNFVSTS